MKLIILILLSGILTGLVFLGAVNNIFPILDLTKKDKTDKTDPQIVIENTSEIIATKTPVPMPKSSYIDGVYRNPVIGIVISIPSPNIDECSDLSCVFLDKKLSIRLEELENKKETNIKNKIMNSDLYCSAAGPNGYVDCKNLKVLDYKNIYGLTGYKVERNIDSSDIRGIVNDYAYVFLTNNFLISNEVIIFQSSNYLPESLLILDQIVSKTQFYEDNNENSNN